MLNTDLRVNGPVVTERVAHLYTARNWRQFQRSEALRTRCIRVAWIALLSFAALCVLMFK